MATIPQAIDYGARPSTRVSRVDVPGEGNLAVSEAVAAAAENFSRILVERKQTEDAFNYSMAKQEWLTADLTNREKLKDDRDYETFDERYRDWMKGDRDRITKRWKMTPHDRAIFDAEADLIRERGAAGVQEFRRVLEIDDNLAALDGALTLIADKVSLAPPKEKNEILLTALDQINAAEKNKWLNKTDAEKKRRELVQTVAAKSLANMDPEERKKALEASLTYRKTTGPLTPDDIRADKGTGSIADFLHVSEAKAMLEATEEELEIDNAQAEGYAEKDRAWEEFQGLGTDARKGRAAIYKAIESPEARKAAEAADARELLLQGAARQEGWREIDETLTEMIDDGRSWEELPGNLRSQLPPGMKKTRKEYAIAARKNENYPLVTSSEAIDAYTALDEQGRADWNENEYMDKGPLLEPKRWADAITRDQGDHWKAAARQTKEAIAAGTVKPKSPLTVTQRMDAVFSKVMTKPGADDDLDEHREYDNMILAYENAVIRAGGRDAIDAEQDQQILNDVVRFEVFQRRPLWDKKVMWTTLEPKYYEELYLPLKHPIPPTGETAHTMIIEIRGEPGVDDYKGSALNWLKTKGSNLNPEDPGQVPDDDVLEEAWFYFITQGAAAAQERLSGVEGR